MDGAVPSSTAELSSIPADLLSATEELVGAQLDFQPAPDSDLGPAFLEQLAPPQPTLLFTVLLLLLLAALMVAICLLSLQRLLRAATAGLFSPCFHMHWLFDFETGGVALVLTGLQLEPELAERVNKYCVGMQGVGVPCRLEASIDELRVRLRLKRALRTLLRPARWLEEESNELPELLLLSVRGLRLQHTELPVNAWAGAAARERVVAAIREAATAELTASLAALRRLGTPAAAPAPAAGPTASAASAASSASAAPTASSPSPSPPRPAAAGLLRLAAAAAAAAATAAAAAAAAAVAPRRAVLDALHTAVAYRAAALLRRTQLRVDGAAASLLCCSACLHLKAASVCGRLAPPGGGGGGGGGGGAAAVWGVSLSFGRTRLWLDEAEIVELEPHASAQAASASGADGAHGTPGVRRWKQWWTSHLRPRSPTSAAPHGRASEAEGTGGAGDNVASAGTASAGGSRVALRLEVEVGKTADGRRRVACRAAVARLRLQLAPPQVIALRRLSVLSAHWVGWEAAVRAPLPQYLNPSTSTSTPTSTPTHPPPNFHPSRCVSRSPPTLMCRRR